MIHQKKKKKKKKKKKTWLLGGGYGDGRGLFSLYIYIEIFLSETTGPIQYN